MWEPGVFAETCEIPTCARKWICLLQLQTMETRSRKLSGELYEHQKYVSHSRATWVSLWPVSMYFLLPICIVWALFKNSELCSYVNKGYFNTWVLPTRNYLFHLTQLETWLVASQSELYVLKYLLFWFENARWSNAMQLLKSLENGEKFDKNLGSHGKILKIPWNSKNYMKQWKNWENLKENPEKR